MLEQIISLIGTTLLIDTSNFSEDTPLLGVMPELDSVGVVMILTAIETQFGLSIADDEVDASIFETVASLTAFVASQPVFPPVADAPETPAGWH